MGEDETKGERMEREGRGWDGTGRERMGRDGTGENGRGEGRGREGQEVLICVSHCSSF